MLRQSVNKPPIYTKSQVKFWDDEYISKQMLKAHLDPEFEAATRKADFVDKSVAWIKELVSPEDYPTLLDLGCGPGIYAEKFTKMGYQVTGIDFSKRSIEYATQSAKQKQLEITYRYQSYLELELQKKFDFATMIYCDYGALSTEDRKTILKKAYDHLKPGGKFLFDVFTMKSYERFEEIQTWENIDHDGFWCENPYIALNGFYKYPDNVTMQLTTVLSQGNITSYYIWDTYFTKESLIEEVECCGFKVYEIYSDVAGRPYQGESETIAILLEKPTKDC